MFEAFDKAITDRGWTDVTGAYGLSIQYFGYSQLGEIAFSFGSGTDLRARWEQASARPARIRPNNKTPT
jgi:hypothetical protein